MTRPYRVVSGVVGVSLVNVSSRADSYDVSAISSVSGVNGVIRLGSGVGLGRRVGLGVDISGVAGTALVGVETVVKSMASFEWASPGSSIVAFTPVDSSNRT